MDLLLYICSSFGTGNTINDNKKSYLSSECVTNSPQQHQQIGLGIFQEEEFEDTKGVTRIRKSKDRQHNGQQKKDNRIYYDLQYIHTKPLKSGGELRCSERVGSSWSIFATCRVKLRKIIIVEIRIFCNKITVCNSCCLHESRYVQFLCVFPKNSR